MTEYSPKESRKTALKTFRLPVDVIDALERESTDGGTSLNSLVLTILTRHVEWDSNARKLGFVSISRVLLEGLIRTVDRDGLIKLARNEYAAAWVDRTMFLFQEATIENIIKVLDLAARHQGIFDINVKTEGTEYTIAMHHDLGPMFSLLLENAFDEIWRSQFHIQPTFRTGDTAITMHFSIP